MKRFLTLFLILIPTLINAQKVNEVLSADADVIIKGLKSRNSVIIDGRTVAMYDSGHIRGAICIDADSQNAMEELSKYLKKRTIVVYCTTNRRTTKIVGLLKDCGYKGNIIAMTDGITGWKANGLDVIVSNNSRLPVDVR